MAFALNRAELALLEILKEEISEKENFGGHILSVEALTQVMQLAQEHTVSGLVADAVIEGRLTVAPVIQSRTETAKLMRTRMNHLRMYHKFATVIGRLAILMDKHNIRYVMFKGMAVARFYKSSYARTMGDVDFYVPDSSFYKAVSVIEQEWHIAIDKDDIDKHFCFEYEGIRLEIHSRIETFGNNRHQRYFNRMIDGSIANEKVCFELNGIGVERQAVFVSVLSPIEDLIVVFKHWFNHLIVEGVGLRQTVDLAVLLQSYKGKTDRNRLQHHLTEIGYLDAFLAMAAMMKKYFSLSCVDNLFLLSKKDEIDGDMLMATVMESGNFGKLAYKNHSFGVMKSFETAKIALRHCAKFFWFAPTDILCLMPKRIGITLKRRFEFLEKSMIFL